jgi:transporter family protein
MRSYLSWALLALLGYSIFTPLAQVATERVPSTVVALVANTILASSALAVVLFNGEDPVSYLSTDALPYMIGAGFFLSVGILAYYRALSLGPVSVVTPVYGMFLVGSSVLGFLFLGDELTARKAAGIALAVVAVYLTVTG